MSARFVLVARHSEEIILSDLEYAIILHIQHVFAWG